MALAARGWRPFRRINAGYQPAMPSLAQGLAARFTADQALGSGRVHDSSGYFNNGSGVNLGVQAGLRADRPVFRFTGSSCIALSPGVSVGANLTYTAWIKPTAVTAGVYQNLISASPAFGIWLHGDKLDLFLSVDHDATTGVLPNVWSHVAVVVSNNGARADYYVNGQTAGSSVVSFSSATLAQIGSDNNNGTVETFTGGMDDIRVYTRALSAAEVLALYAEAFQPAPSINAPLGLIDSTTARGWRPFGFLRRRGGWKTKQPGPYTVDWTRAPRGLIAMMVADRGAVYEIVKGGQVKFLVSNVPAVLQSRLTPLPTGFGDGLQCTDGGNITANANADYTSLGSFGVSNPSTPVCSLEAWVYALENYVPTMSGGICGVADNDPSNGTNDRKIYINASVNCFSCMIFDGGVKSVDGTSVSITAGTLYHVVMTSDGSNLRLYVNGAFMGLIGTVGAGFNGYTAPVFSFAGAATNGGGTNLSVLGVVTLSTAIANVVWSAAEIAARYNDPWGFLIPPQVSNALGLITSTVASAGWRPFKRRKKQLPLGLVGWWPFDDGSALDASGYNNNGTLVAAPKPVGGIAPSTLLNRLRGALQFLTASSQYVTSSAHVVNLTSGYSISLWVNSSDAGNENLYGEGAADNSTFNIQYSTGVTRMFFRNHEGATLINAAGTRTIADGKWHHVVWTDNAGATALYIDSVLDGTSFNYVPSGTFSPTANAIGAEFRGIYDNFATGAIDDVRIYNRVLPPGEVRALYAEPFQPEYGIESVAQSMTPSSGFIAAFRRTLSWIGARVGARQTHRG